MSDWVYFEAVIEPMVWGDSTYTVLPLSQEVMSGLGDARRVEGEFNDHPVNLAVTKAPVLDRPFLYTGKSLLDRAQLLPGEPFEARLRPADPNHVDVPADVKNALLSGGVWDAWEALTPGKQRGHLHQIESAKRMETRANRITKLLQALA